MSDASTPIPARWKLKDVLILVAVLAVGFAVIGVAGTSLLTVMFAPVWLAPRGQRWSRVFWVGAVFPVIMVLWLYVVWIHGWIALGHPPRSSLDDPKDIDQIEFTYAVMFLFLVICPFVFVISLFSTIFKVISPKRQEWHWFRRSYPLFLVPSLWGLTWADEKLALPWHGVHPGSVAHLRGL